MTTINRGDFVRLGSMFAGSLVLGVGASGCANQSHGAPAGSPAPELGGFKPNAWLIVHPDEKVTIFVNKSEMGQGVATGMPTIVADELDIPMENVLIEFAPAAAVYADPGFHLQITGGSTSTASMWMPLRTAGASAREMLVAAAAKQWGVDPSTLTTKSGSVVDAKGNRTATYGSLAGAAASIPAPAKPTLKTPDQFTLIGKVNKRIDTPLKVNGSAKYGIDVRVPGMKFASVLYPPVFGAKVKSFDASKAKQVKGVIDVVQIPSGIAVVADNSWAAFQGKAALNVTYDNGPFANQSTETLKARYLKLASQGTGAVPAVARGSANVSGTRLNAIYFGNLAAHATMEPMNATASVTNDGVEIWAPTQVQSFAQASAAKIAGVSPDKVTIHTTYLGGGFGRRLYTDFTDDAVAVSKAIKAPVQVIWQREDDTQHDWYKPMGANSVSGTLDANGDLVAMQHTVVMDSILEGLHFPLKNGLDSVSMDSVINSQYEIPNFHAYYIDPESGVPAGSLRAPGANWNNFVMESFMDELAHAAGKDPLAFRLALLKKNPHAANVLKTAAKNAGWGSPAPGTKQGLAFGFWNGTPAATVAEVSMDGTTPRVHRAFVVADVGRAVNPTIVRQQLEGATNYGLSMALASIITIKNGAVQQHNFYDYLVLRIDQAPQINVEVLESGGNPSGIGEIATILIAPAVANAVFALNGKRARVLPFSEAYA
ncbi:MAG TPA: xanthine dehydrogenase family protein molybdopterin-binding subunit [Alphaproteobacteria bacterium]|nr:xanthine dehydrogenase family protein molybdopterin-binding subunit [Alphaproteobacteria bacterium]